MAGNEQRFQQAMNQGHSAAWDQAWKDAAAFYRQALEEFPDHPKALTSLGLALYQLQDYKGSILYYQKAAKVSPNDPLPFEKMAELLELTGGIDQACEARLRAAEMYMQIREVNKAIDLWIKIVNQKPDHLAAHSRLALVYERTGQKEQAVTEYLAVASIMQASGDMARAAQVLTRAQQLMPESPDPGRALSMLQAGQRLPRPTRPAAATAPLTPQAAAPRRPEVAQLGGGSAPAPEASPGLDPIAEARQKALAALAAALFDQGDDDAQTSRRGMQAIVRGEVGSSAPQVDQAKVLLHLSQAIELQSRGETGRALDDLMRAVEAGLEHPSAFFDLGLLLWEADRLDDAIKYLQRVITHADYNLGAHLLLGQVYANMGKALEATVEVLEALRLADAQMVAPNQAEALKQMYDPLVEAQMQQPNSETQVRLYNNVREMLVRPDWREYLARAREQLPAQTDGAPPSALAEMLSEARSSQMVEAIAKINLLAQAGHYRTAMEEAFYALQSAPTYLPLHVSMADLLLRQDRRTDAVVKYKTIAQSYSIRGEAVRAISTIRRIIELSPMDMDARSQLIELMIVNSQTEEAANEYLRLVDVYYSLADLPNARKTCNQALRLTQQSNVSKTLRLKVLHRLADIDLQSIDWRSALRSYEQIRSLQPDDEKACTSLIELNLRLGNEPQAMKELDNYMGALMQSGQRPKVINFLENLISENQKLPGARRRLGELYRQMGRNDEAIEQLDAAGEFYLEVNNKAAAAETIMVILSLNPPNVADYQKLLMQINR